MLSNKIKKLLSGCLAVALAFTMVPLSSLAADGGGHAGSGGGGSGTGGSGTGSTGWNHNLAGTKVSLIKVPTGSGTEADKWNPKLYEGGFMMSKTPMGSAPGNSSGISETKGINAIYFMNKYNSTKELIANSSGFSVYDFKRYIVADNSSKYGLTAEENKQWKSVMAAAHDWNLAAKDSLAEMMGIPQKDEIKDDATKQAVTNKFRAIAKVMKTMYPNGESKALDAMAKNGCYVENGYEYMFVCEPIMGLSINSGSNTGRYGMTPLQMAQCYLGRSGDSIREQKSLKDTWGLIREADYSYFDWILNLFIGSIDGNKKLSENDLANGSCYAVKIFYQGPNNKGTYADMDDNKWGSGILKPSDSVQVGNSKEVFYGIADVDNIDLSGGSGFRVGTGDIYGYFESAPSLDSKSKVLSASDPRIIQANKMLTMFGLKDFSTVLAVESSSGKVTSRLHKLPTADNLKGISDVAGSNDFYTVVEKQGSAISYVSKNNDLAKVYGDSVSGIVSAGTTQIDYGDGTVDNAIGSSAYLWNTAVWYLGGEMTTQIVNGGHTPLLQEYLSKNKITLSPMISNKGGNMAYGRGDIGKFQSLVVNHSAVKQTMLSVFNMLKEHPDLAQLFATDKGKRTISGYSGEDNDAMYARTLALELSDKATKKEISDTLLRDGLKKDSDIEVAPNKDGGELFKGTAIGEYALVASGKKVVYQLVEQKPDGSFGLIDKDSTLDLGLTVPYTITKYMPIPSEIQTSNGVNKVDRVVVKSASVDTTTFLTNAQADLKDNNERTKANGAFEVPILDYESATDYAGQKVIEMGARPEDLLTPNPIVVMLVLGKESPTTVIKVVDKKDGTHISTIVTTTKNRVVDAKNNGDDKVVEWFTGKDKPENVDDSTPWSVFNPTYKDPTGLSGIGEGKIDVSTKPDQDVIYIRYIQDDSLVIPSGSGKKGSEYISFQYDLTDLGVGPLNLQTSLTSFGFGSHKWYCSGCKGNSKSGYWCPGHPCYDAGWTDRGYTVIGENTASLDPKVIAPDSGIYAFKYKNNRKSGSMEPEPELKGFDIMAVAHRGYDVVTLAKYKKNVQAWNDLAILKYPTGYTPQGTRSNGGYSKSLRYFFELVGSDLKVSKICGKNGITHNAYLYLKQSLDYVINILQTKGKQNTSTVEPTVLNKPSTHMNGIEIKNLKAITSPRGNATYYPYVQMLYETNSKTNVPVMVLADHTSTIKPTDYLEFGWTSTQDNTIEVISNQFSTHERATNGTEWRKRDKVLPGGAMFGVRDNPNNKTIVGLTTYQPFIPDSILNEVGTVYSLNWLDLASKEKEHNDAAKALIDQLEKTDLQMMANTNWGGGLTEESGARIVYKSGSFNSRTLSGDNKYWLQLNTSGVSNKNTEADFDTRNRKDTTTYYKLKSDVNGNIYALKSKDNTNWTTLKTWAKTDTASQIISQFPTEIKDADNRTKMFTNFVIALDRNLGWYNEAWDGVCVVKKETTFEFGLFNPAIRQAVLDPQLTPKLQNRADMFTKAHTFGFRSETKTVSIPFSNGTALKFDPKYIHKTDKYYAPNITVTDIFQ